MQSSTKVFVQLPTITGYVYASQEPLVIQLQINTEIKYHVVRDDVILTPFTENWQYNADVGDTPGTIFSALYTQILATCGGQDYPTPGQTDIFCFVPTALSQIFIDIPSLA